MHTPVATPLNRKSAFPEDHPLALGAAARTRPHGMDLETALRCRIPILTVVLNNGVMGGYGEWLPDAVERHAADRLGGCYADVAKAMGGHGGQVEDPRELRAAFARCVAAVGSGRAALLELMTREESAFAPDAARLGAR